LRLKEFFPCNKITLNSHAVIHYYLIVIQTGQNSKVRSILKEYVFNIKASLFIVIIIYMYGSPGWGLGERLTTSHRKKYKCLETWNEPSIREAKARDRAVAP
jgi:hypothetical protein